MIYDGKEYVEIEQKDAKIGDLLHITMAGIYRCNIHKFIYMITDDGYFVTGTELPDGHSFLYNGDIFRTYKYVKDVEETPVPKEQIIPLTNPKKAHDLINQTSKNITQTDTVNSPSHYNQTKIEAIDIIEDVTAGYQSNVKYHIGNAIKYLIRAPFKNNTVEDLKKAVWYIQRAIEKLEGEE